MLVGLLLPVRDALPMPQWSVVLKPPPVRDVVSRVPVTALSFPGGEQRFSAVGCENGALGVCQLHDRYVGRVWRGCADGPVGDC